MKILKSGPFALVASVLIATQLIVACAPAPATAAPSSAPTAMSMPMPTTAAPAAPATSVGVVPVTGTDPLVFRETMRKLWEDHITWTRVYIIAAVAGLPETDTAAQRLLQNQVDIGDAVKPFYGDQAGNQLTALLKQHILLAADLITAAKAGDTAKFSDTNQRWHDNADQIAAFLHNANPEDWPLADMQSMMKSHLDLTLAEASARLKSDWPGDVAAYDKVHDEILQMADMLSEGIIKQFPDKFAPEQASQKQVALTLAMNKLWEDHITWTRVYIMSATSGLPDTAAAAQRLLQNQVDIGNAVKPFYGEQAGDQLTALLKQHILIAVDLLNAAKANDTAKFNDANQRWHANADQIAAFLHHANPSHWALGDMQSMMKSHLELTLAEASARLKSDWPGDVSAYDKVHEEILQMAGMLTQGIVAQFPDKFK